MVLVMAFIAIPSFSQKKGEAYPWKFEDVKQSLGNQIVSSFGSLQGNAAGVNVVWDIENQSTESIFPILTEVCFFQKGWKIKADKAACQVDMRSPGATVSIAVIDMDGSIKIMGSWFHVPDETTKYAFKSPQTHGKNFFNKLFKKLEEKLND
jgi:hypothetical protein